MSCLFFGFVVVFGFFLIKGMLENCSTNTVIHLKLNQKVFRGRSMISHFHKFEYEEKQKQLKKK